VAELTSFQSLVDGASIAILFLISGIPHAAGIKELGISYGAYQWQVVVEPYLSIA
jgi:hypothetical protein